MRGRPWRVTERGVLGLRGFRLLLASQSLSALGSQFFPIAVALTVLEAGGGPAEVGLVLGARVLAVVAFVVLGGVWADRLPRRQVLLFADSVRLVATVGLVVGAGQVGVGGLAALTFVVGAGEAFFRPAYIGLVPSLVPLDRLEAANSWKAGSESLVSVVGPALAGLTVAVAGVQAAFAVNATTFLLSLVLIYQIRAPRPREPSSRNVVSEVREGLSAIRRTRWVVRVLVMTSVQTTIVVASHQVFLPVVADERLGGAAVYGIVLAAFSLSGLVGSIVVGRVRPRRPGTVAVVSVACFAAAPLVLLLPVPPSVVVVGYAIAGFAMMPFNILWESALQRQFPSQVLGRVSSVDWLASLGLLPVGLLLVGPAADLLGRDAVLAVAVVTQLVSSAVVLGFRDVRAFDDAGTSSHDPQ